MAGLRAWARATRIKHCDAAIDLAAIDNAEIDDAAIDYAACDYATSAIMRRAM